MSIEPIGKNYVTNRVADKLKELLLSGEYQPGEKLPSIKELAAAFDVGQTTVREGLRFLESLGLIKILHGSGVFVRDAVRVPLSIRPIISSAPLDQNILHDLISMRQILETGAAEFAATNATPNQVTELKHLLSKMEESIDRSDPFSQYNADFHMLVSESSGNAIIPLFLKTLRELIVRHQERLNTSPEIRLRSLAFHRRIFEAILARDPALARSEMEAHLADIHDAVRKSNEDLQAFNS